MLDKITSVKSPQDNLERIAELLEKIESHMAPPPMWQRVIKFTFQHLVFFFTLFTLLYFTWKTWEHVSVIVEYISSMLEKMGVMQSAMDAFSGQVSEKVENLKFWK